MILKKFCIFFYLFTLVFSTVVFANLDEDEIVSPLDIKEDIVQANSSFESVSKLNSRSAIVIDRKTKTILFGKNEYDVRKMASTTKIMTAIVVIENANLYDTIVVSKKAGNTGGSRLGIKEGDKLTVCDLLYGLLLKSGNDTAVALAEHVGGSLEGFAELMNNKAQKLNLINTHFVTPHGLDNDNHYTTAYELAILTDYALNNETFRNIVCTTHYSVTINDSEKKIANTNELLGNLNGVYGVKTGFTNGANRCLITSCKRGNLDVICVVLGCDTKKFRTRDSISLIEYVFSNYEMVNLREIVYRDFNEWKHTNLANFRVSKGIVIPLEVDLDSFNYELYPVKKEYLNNLHTTISCNYNLEAPLPANSVLGNMDVIINDFPVLNFNIVNKIKIDKKDCYGYVLEFLTNYFKYLTINF